MASLEAWHVMLSLFNALYSIFSWPLNRGLRDVLDLLYLSLMGAIMGHWVLFKNECILSHFEKVNMDPSYKLGECPYVNPFMHVLRSFVGELAFLLIINVLPYISVVIVLCRCRLLSASMKAGYAIVVTIFLLFGKVLGNRASTESPRCKALDKAAHDRALKFRF